MSCVAQCCNFNESLQSTIPQLNWQLYRPPELFMLEVNTGSVQYWKLVSTLSPWDAIRHNAIQMRLESNAKHIESQKQWLLIYYRKINRLRPVICCWSKAAPYIIWILLTLANTLLLKNKVPVASFTSDSWKTPMGCNIRGLFIQVLSSILKLCCKAVWGLWTSINPCAHVTYRADTDDTDVKTMVNVNISIVCMLIRH